MSSTKIHLVDSHAHLYLEAFEKDRDAVINRARAQGVQEIFMPAIDVSSVHQALALCEQYSGLYAMAAIHPSETKTASEADFEAIRQLADDPRVVAIGETGLDYYWDQSFIDRQQQFLRWHIQLALEKNLPLVFHNREATEDLVRILKEERDASPTPERLRGIFHCFTGPDWLIEEARALGFLLGIGGIVTFKKSPLPALLQDLSLDEIVLETDAPYLAPVPFRGKRNEPAYLRYIAEKVASIKQVPVEEVARVTSANALRLFQGSP